MKVMARNRSCVEVQKLVYLWSKVEWIYSEHCIKFQFVISLSEETNEQMFLKCLRKSQGWFVKYQREYVTNATQRGEIGKTGRMSLSSLLIWFFWAWWRWDAAMYQQGPTATGGKGPMVGCSWICWNLDKNQLESHPPQDALSCENAELSWFWEQAEI